MLRQLFAISTIAFTLLPLTLPPNIATLPHGTPKTTSGSGRRLQLPPNPLLGALLPQSAIAAGLGCTTDKAGTQICILRDGNGRHIGTTISRLNGRSRVVPVRAK
jgi:hypothetical protein